MVDWDGLREEGLQGVDHGEAGAEDGDQADGGGGDGFCFVGVAQGGCVLFVAKMV